MGDLTANTIMIKVRPVEAAAEDGPFGEKPFGKGLSEGRPDRNMIFTLQ